MFPTRLPLRRTPVLCASLLGLVAATPVLAHLSVIRQGAESAGFREAEDRFGFAVVAGDFNGDGKDDLATGSPTEASTGANESGVVIISYGSTHGLTHIAATSLFASNFAGVPLTPRLHFGHALAAADLNDDGFDDLIVGAPGAPVNGEPRAGRICIYAGSPGGLVPWVTYIQEDIGGFSTPHDHFGHALVTGNLNNDLHEDIVIGSPGRDGQEGTVFVLYGDATGPFGSTQILTAEILGATLDVGDHFGYSLAVGNVIGDTRNDLIIGAPHREAFGQNSAGVCFLVRGSSGGLLTTGGERITAKIADDVAAGADFGLSVATIPTGVFDRIAIGEPDRYLGSTARAGRVLLVNGGPDGVDYNSTTVLTQETFGATSEDYDGFGTVLASGYFEDDSFMDLAIGTPGKDWLAAGSGLVHLALGGVQGLGNSGHYVFGQNAIGGVPEAGDALGASLAFGRFDATGKGTLIIGVPGEDANAGAVHVVAPWRQFFFPGYDTAFVRDCQGDIVYSHKAFQEVYIASTTKIMTVLLACERALLPPGHPNHVPLSRSYTVPDWVAEEIGGSTADLEEGEVTTLENLMYFALLISGNDAAHAIADVLHGGHAEEAVASFVAEMNNRANELGMTNTRFNNPNGFEQEAIGWDLGDHYSSAFDMEILSRAAMQNPLFREISETVTKTILRHKPGGMVEHTFGSFQTWILQNNMGVTGSGLKGGWTPAAKTTWCVSLEGAGPSRAIATTFGTADGPTARADALRLVTLGLDDCATWQHYEEPVFSYIREGIQATLAHAQLFQMQPTTPMSMQFDLFQANAEVSRTDARMRLQRQSEMAIDQNEIIPFGVAPFEAHEQFAIRNLSDRFTKIYVQTPDYANFFDIPAGGQIYVPASSGAAPSFDWFIRSHDGAATPLHLSVEETYVYDVLEPDVVTSDPVFSAVVERDPRTASDDALSLRIEWREAGGEYVLAVHDPETVVSSPEPQANNGGQRTVLALAPAAPNPFTTETRIGFALREPALVGVSVLDVTGRRIRDIPATHYGIGSSVITWDGRSDGGVQVSPGVYFYRIVADGREAGGGKLNLLR